MVRPPPLKCAVDAGQPSKKAMISFTVFDDQELPIAAERAGEDGTGETIRFGDSADCIPDTPTRWNPTVRKSLVFGTSYPVFNRGGFQVVRCPLRVTSRHTATTFPTSAFGGEADGNQRPSERPLIARSGPSSLSEWSIMARFALFQKPLMAFNPRTGPPPRCRAINMD